MPSLAEQIELACLLEATARKPGNVHPAAAFDNLCYDDFVTAAAVSAPLLARTHECGIGRAVFDAVSATCAATGTNVNLGMCLLLAPLAAGAARGLLWEDVRAALAASTVEDTDWIYRAIRLAQPGGLGTSTEQDVSQPPTLTIPAVMALAADRDDVARELATGFQRLERDIMPFLISLLPPPLSKGGMGGGAAQNAAPNQFTSPNPPLAGGAQEMPPWERAIILTHLKLISEGDTLIRRKCGDTVCQEAAERAHRVLTDCEASGRIDGSILREFDGWLRADGHRRNPGTSADLLAAALFVALHERLIDAPTRDQLGTRADHISRGACR